MEALGVGLIATIAPALGRRCSSRNSERLRQLGSALEKIGQILGSKGSANLHSGEASWGSSVLPFLVERNFSVGIPPGTELPWTGGWGDIINMLSVVCSVTILSFFFFYFHSVLAAASL